MPSDPLEQRTWSPAYTFKELLQSKKLQEQYRQPGVYIHTDHRARQGVAYVGKVSGKPDLWTRQYDHYAFCIGGLYKLPELDSESAPYRWNPDRDCLKTTPTRFKEKDFLEIVRYAFRYVQEVRIHLCVLPTHEDSKAVELELIYALQPLDNDNRGKESKPRTTLLRDLYRSAFPELPRLIELGKGLRDTKKGVV